MKKIETEFSSSRRETMKKLALGSTAGLFGLLGSPIANAQKKPNPQWLQSRHASRKDQER